MTENLKDFFSLISYAFSEIFYGSCVNLVMILAFLWGIIWGSFGGTILYRSIHNISIIQPHFSFCPNCKRKLKWFHNIPLLSYIILQGKCAYCKKKIEITYFISELLSGIVGIFCAIFSESFIDFLGMFFFVWGILIASISDVKFLLVPLLSVLFSSLGAIIKIVETKDIMNSAFGAAFGAGSFLFIKIAYKLVRKREGLGEGDVIFMIPVGLYLGLFGTILSLVFSSFLGGLTGTITTVISKRKEFPFIPFIFISVVMVIVIKKTFPNFSFL